MDKDSLQKRLQDIEQRFYELATQKTGLDDEMKRLQGEYRLLSDLLNVSNVTKPKRLRKVVEEDAATNPE